MRKLAAGYHYRLRMLMGRPRFYKPDAVMRWLQRRALIEATGQEEADGRRVEYAITDQGRDALRQTDVGEPQG